MILRIWLFLAYRPIRHLVTLGNGPFSPHNPPDEFEKISMFASGEFTGMSGLAFSAFSGEHDMNIDPMNVKTKVSPK